MDDEDELWPLILKSRSNKKPWLNVPTKRWRWWTTHNLIAHPGGITKERKQSILILQHLLYWYIQTWFTCHVHLKIFYTCIIQIQYKYLASSKYIKQDMTITHGEFSLNLKQVTPKTHYISFKNTIEKINFLCMHRASELESIWTPSVQDFQDDSDQNY
jgi:hypothetical protein